MAHSRPECKVVDLYEFADPSKLVPQHSNIESQQMFTQSKVLPRNHPLMDDLFDQDIELGDLDDDEEV